MLDNAQIKNADELEFAVFCIENIAKRLGKNAEDVYRLLTEKSDILNSYIIPEYEMLHTQSKEYIIDDIVDFGRGFYTTPLYDQAVKWCEKFKRRGKSGIVSRYDFDEKAYQELKVLKFDSYSEEWLDFILKCRTGNDATDYDIVIGGVANDKVFNTVELYFDNLIDKGEAIRRLRYEMPNLQICFRTQKALNEYLHYEGSDQI